MKKFYTDPEALVILLRAADILTASEEDPDDDQSHGDDPFVD